MSFQVTIYTEAEKRAYWRDVEEKGKPVGEWACYHPARDCVGFFGGAYIEPARLDWGFFKPPSNMITDKRWVEMCADALNACRRADGDGRGITLEEFEEMEQRRGIGLPRTERAAYARGGGYEGNHTAAVKRFQRVKKLAFGL